jgi:RHS repeat-associated protein
VTNHYQLSVVGPANQSLTFDANGNMTSDGTNSYAWDCENRLIQVTYPGAQNYSSFTYDGLDHNVQIVETRGGTVTSTKQFVWCGEERCEARNATGTVTAQYLRYGETISGSNYYYSKDHLGSICEMADSSGNVQAEYRYDPWGRVTQLQASLASDFQYAGYYFHSPSGLNLTLHRAYSPALAHWLSRDPLDINPENGQPQPALYTYAEDDPIDLSDPLGLVCVACSMIPSRPGGPNRPGPPPDDKRKGYCLSYDCCIGEFNRCRYECYRRYLNEGKSKCWLDHCLGCCDGKRIWCINVIVAGYRFYVWVFDDCWSD